jgi:acyl-CoA synthetase (AMP-forming)/AMP-acid ligase II
MGASVYLLDEDSRAVPALCRDWLVSHGITITFLPTALAEGVMALEWPRTTALRFLLTGADTLHHYPSPTLPFALVNNYGPTEATVVATSGQVFPAEHINGPPSIGRSIANTQISILNEHLQQVPIGELGELYIGGVGLAKGYLNRSELTNEKFIPHPFSNEPGARLYKTGDLARYLPDGQIAFMGRTDYQVKIRGFRFELGEIEVVLSQHPAVCQTVVIACDGDVPGEKRLVAYVVTGQQNSTVEQHLSKPSVALAELQGFLQAQLPDYMIPTVFVLLKALPLTPNGKVDRVALPAPDANNMVQNGTIAAPSTPTEKRLAEIVTGLLKLEQVGVDDNFFLLGGHSLLGTQVIAEVSQIFGVHIFLHTLFEAPTIRLLSAEVERLIFARVQAMSEDEILHLLEQEYNT